MSKNNLALNYGYTEEFIKFIINKYDKIKELVKEIERLNNIINKAIDKLEESQKGLEEWHFDGYDPCLEEIIKILKGEDNE